MASTNHDIRAVLRGENRRGAINLLKKMGAQQGAQTFIDLYMSPTELSDLENRLGKVISANDEVSSVKDVTFPPYNITVNKAGIGFRAGGFRQVNNKINQLQRLNRLITGEIRTKMTEWDISLYLQEGWITDETMFDLSLLYRIYLDNPKRYTDSRALIYGILNAALSYERYKVYNPAADPELAAWIPPAPYIVDPTQADFMNRVYDFVRAGYDWNESQKQVLIEKQKAYGSTDWQEAVSAGGSIYDVLTRLYQWTPVLSDWQKEEIDWAKRAGWTTWYPQYWQLFFNSSNPTSIDTTEYENIVAARIKKMASKKNTGRQPATKPSNVSLLSYDAESRSMGVNINSPLFYGHPYGRYSDPASLQGYLNNHNISTPKIDYKRRGSGSINSCYPYGNPTEGFYKAFNGWTSTRISVTYIESDVQTKTGVDNYGNPIYSVGSNITPQSTPSSMTGHYPGITGVLRTPGASSRTISQLTYKHNGVTETREVPVEPSQGNPEGKTTITVPVRTWGWSQVDVPIQPDTLLQLTDVSGGDLNTILGEPNGLVPAIFVSADRRIVIIASIHRAQYTCYGTRKVRFLWWTWEESYTYLEWGFYVDMNSAQAFHIDNNRQTPSVSVSSLPLKYFNDHPMSVSGIYFDIPARTLAPTDGILTGGWSGTGIDTTSGAAIIRALITPLWYNSSQYLRAPVRACFRDLKNLFTPVLPLLNELYTVIEKASGSAINSIIDQFDEQTQAKSSIQHARSLFSDSYKASILGVIDSCRTSINGFLATLNTLISASTGDFRVEAVQAFLTTYPGIGGAVSNPQIVDAVRSYLNVLYEQRFILLKQRLNKQDGTLMRVAQCEMSLSMMEDSLVQQPELLDALFSSKLAIRHKVTNISLAERLADTDLPTEKVRIVYVKVDYTDSGDVFRPPAGDYSLYSRESVDISGLTPPTWYISFKESEAPVIINDVVTTIDPVKLQGIMLDSNLTDLEKVCFARTLEDWWEIKIPIAQWPDLVNYQNDLYLILAKSNEAIDNFVTTTGGDPEEKSPIVDSTTRIEIGATWMASPELAKKVARLNS